MCDLACLNPGLTILPTQQPCAFRYRIGYSQRLTKTGLAANPSLVYTRYVHSASVGKGPSIYDIHKKITFFTPPVHMRPHGPDPPPPLWTSTHGRHEIHTALLKWLVPDLKLKFDYMILIYLNCTISNLYH